MNRKATIGLLLTISLVAIGCSSTTDPALQQGDINDPEFLQAQAQWESAIAMAVGSMDVAMDFSFNNPADTVTPVRGRGQHTATPAVDTFSYSYDPVSGWHVAYASFSETGLAGSVLDSVQFQDAANEVQQDYDESTTDQIHVIEELAVSASDTLMQGDFNSAFDLTLSGLTGSVAVANGDAALEFNLTIEDTASTCDMSMGFTQQFDQVGFVAPLDETDGICPVSGSMHMTGTVAIACTGDGSSLTYNESWIVRVTFLNDGTMDVEAQSGNTVWTYNGDIPCGNYENPF